MSPHAQAAPTRAPLAGRRRTAALITMLLAMFMDLLDTTIVNVAIPPIQRGLDASYSAIQWVVAGYALAFALVLITGGRLGDIAGRRRMFLIGVAGFTAASLLCGLAASPGMLVGARVLQGAMAALMVPQVLSAIQVMYPPRERAAALGAFAGLAGLATVGGPVLGALLTEGDLFGLGWRAIFLINVPVGLLALVAAWFLVPESRSPQPLRLDLTGVGLVTAGLLLLLYPLMQGRQTGWPAWGFVALAASVPVLVLFVAHERRRTRADGSPLVVLELFRLRTFTAGLAVLGIFMAAIMTFFLVFSLYLQQGLGFSVLHAGLTMLPWSIGVPLAAGIAGPVLVPRFGRRILTIGAALTACGLAGVALTASAYGAGLASWQLIPSLVVGGLGMGMVIAPIFDFATADVPAGDAGSGSGLLSATQQLGAAGGVAVLGVLFFGLLGDRPATGDFTTALFWTLWAEVGLLLLTAVATCWLPRRPAHHAPATEPATGTESEPVRARV